jgi:two-component system OmpR family response regulator
VTLSFEWCPGRAEPPEEVFELISTKASLEAATAEREQVRVLVVDDEPYITDLVATALRYEGFEVASAATGREALGLVDTFRPGLIILDIMLPDLDGFEVQRKLVDRGGRIPVLFLTARDATEDKIRGLTIGGDDYVTKPFSLEELIARIRAILRRARNGGADSERLQFADLEMDEDTHEVRRAGQPIELTATEFNLLRFLLSNPRRVLSKGQILDHVWHYDFGGDSSIVETYVSYLRKKVDVHKPHLIHTVRGVGYVLRLPPE